MRHRKWNFWLHSIGLIEPAQLEDFVPLLLDLARIDGSLYSIPRNIDVRLLHFRTDLIETPPGDLGRTA